MTNTQLYLIRHCQANGQEPDATLSASGEQQAQQLAEHLSAAGITRIVSSPFVRAVRSIEPLAQRLHVQIETEPRLQERVLSTEPLPDWRAALRQTFEQLDLSFPGGESSRQAMQRASAAVQDILQTSQASDTVAIVSHGNLTTLLLKHFDDRIDFHTWQQMTTPDVFRLHISPTATNISHLWPPTAKE